MARCRAVQDTAVLDEVTCAFCRGRGTDPFGIMSSRSTCCVCGGSGTVQVRAPHLPCAHCRGTGAVKTLTCTSCAGKGSAPRPPLPIIPCPVCHGTGDDASASAMACLRCRGRGYVTAPPVAQGAASHRTPTPAAELPHLPQPTAREARPCGDASERNGQP